MAFGRKAKKAAKYYAIWRAVRGASALSLLGSAAFGAYKLYKNKQHEEAPAAA